MKRILLFFLCLITLPAYGFAQKPRVAICAYAGRDTFILSMLSEMTSYTKDSADLFIVSADGDQNLQNDQVLRLIDSGIDILAVNPVDRTSAVYLIQLAKTQGLPIILFNREPLREDLNLWEKAYYVGIDPRQQGRLQAQLALDYFNQYPQQDLNGDGIIQYVLLRGEAGHQDSELRSTASQKALNESSLRAEKLAEETADWDKALGQERMARLINSFGKRIECVLSNNDDMALGAIDALKAAGYFTDGITIPIIGVDATAAALEMIDQGTLYGTVENNAQAQAQAVIDLAVLLASGEKITPASFPYGMKNRVVYIESTMKRKEE